MDSFEVIAGFQNWSMFPEFLRAANDFLVKYVLKGSLDNYYLKYEDDIGRPGWHQTDANGSTC